MNLKFLNCRFTFLFLIFTIKLVNAQSSRFTTTVVNFDYFMLGVSRVGLVRILSKILRFCAGTQSGEVKGYPSIPTIPVNIDSCG